MNRWKFLFSGCLVNGPVSGLAWAALLLAFAHGPLWGVEVEARNLCSATAWKLVRVAGPDAEVALDGLVMQPGKSHRVDFQVPGTYRWKVKEADQERDSGMEWTLTVEKGQDGLRAEADGTLALGSLATLASLSGVEEPLVVLEPRRPLAAEPLPAAAQIPAAAQDPAGPKPKPSSARRLF